MHCCPTTIQPVSSVYKGLGHAPYLTGVGNAAKGGKGVLLLTDIFGFHPNALQVADALASRGFLVAVPDIFEGKPWTNFDLPHADPEAFNAFLVANNYTHRKQLLSETIQTLQAMGVKRVGLVGFCMGAKLGIQANADGLVQCSVSIHPAFHTVSDAENAKVPVCLMPSKNDTEMLDFKAVLDKKPFASKNAYRYFGDMHHGWVAARGDFQNELNAKRANEALDLATTFLNNNL